MPASYQALDWADMELTRFYNMADINEIGQNLANHIKKTSSENWPGATLLQVVDGAGQYTDGYVWCDLAGSTVRCIVPTTLDLSGGSQIIYGIPIGDGPSSDYVCIGVAWNGLDNSRIPRIRAAAITDINGDPISGGGGVTSVALSAAPSTVFGVSGSPITTSGTLALTMDNQDANKVLASGASGGASEPAFRALVAADMPAGVNAVAAYEDGVSVVAAIDKLDFKDFNVEDAGSNDASIYHNLPHTWQARLTLETGVPISTTDQTAKTIVYLTPYKGTKISLYDGTRWKIHTLSEISIKTTDAQTGTTHNGTKVIDGLSDTSQLIPGMTITGTGVGAASVIDTIDSATQVTGTVNSTASASVTVTFKVTANTVMDVFCFSNSGTPKLEIVAWTNITTRATALALQDAVHVKNGATTRIYVGTICTTATAGQVEDSIQYRLVWNYRKRIRRKVGITESTNSWTYATNTWRSANNSTANRIGVVVGIAEDFLALFQMATYAANASGATACIGIAQDATNTNDIPGTANIGVCANTSVAAANTHFMPISARFKPAPAVGYHYFQWTETSFTAGATTTFYSAYLTYRQSGIVGTWRC